MNNLLIVVLLLWGVTNSSFLWSQNYTSYFTGNITDIVSTPTGGICIMGGATEPDNAMRWFLERANGGDVLVMRASGSDGYNDYLYSELGVAINSVETIVFNDASASNEAYIQQRIEQAEAIWFAGGNQWNYISYWRNSPIDSLIQQAVADRNIVLGGTSAGMAIQGGYYFSAQNGTITSAEALANPFDNNLTIDSASFIPNSLLTNVITDTHYDNPDRRARHITFLARIATTYGVAAKGIACEEYTAVCIAPNGMARIFGSYPDYDDIAYFLQPNCALADANPELCLPNTPLTWYHNGEAVKVYKVPGTYDGDYTFNLSDWLTGSGGIWEHWSVNEGLFITSEGTAPDCSLVQAPALTSSTTPKRTISIYPQPASDYLYMQIAANAIPKQVCVFNILGEALSPTSLNLGTTTQLELGNLASGIYIVEVLLNDSTKLSKKFVVR